MEREGAVRGPLLSLAPAPAVAAPARAELQPSWSGAITTSELAGLGICALGVLRRRG
jgi:hypothetical protein